MIPASMVLSALLLAGPPDWLVRASFVTAITAHGLDAVSTAWCRAQREVDPFAGCREANPALRWAEDDPIQLGLAKMGWASLLQLIPYHLAKRGHKWEALLFNVGQTVTFTLIARRNARFAARPAR